MTLNGSVLSVNFQFLIFGAKTIISPEGRLLHKLNKNFDCPPGIGGKSLEIIKDFI